MAAKKFTIDDVKHIAQLANLVLSDEQLQKIAEQLSSVIGYMSKIQALDTKGVVETSQVTGLENVFREDVVDEKRMLSQESALSNAKNTHSGYFMVDAVLEE